METNGCEEDSTDSTQQSDSECEGEMKFDQEAIKFMVSSIKEIYDKQISENEKRHLEEITRLTSGHTEHIATLEKRHLQELTRLSAAYTRLFDTSDSRSNLARNKEVIDIETIQSPEPNNASNTYYGKGKD